MYFFGSAVMPRKIIIIILLQYGTARLVLANGRKNESLFFTEAIIFLILGNESVALKGISRVVLRTKTPK